MGTGGIRKGQASRISRGINGVVTVEQKYAVWLQEGDDVEELVFAVQIEIPADTIDHTEEETDAPGFFMDQKFIHDIR